MFSPRLVPVVLALVAAGAAQAQTAVRSERNVSLALANQIAGETVAACQALGYAVAATVVDRAGNVDIGFAVREVERQVGVGLRLDRAVDADVDRSTARDPERRLAMGHAARQRVIGHFGLDALALPVLTCFTAGERTPPREPEGGVDSFRTAVARCEAAREDAGFDALA